MTTNPTPHPGATAPSIQQLAARTDPRVAAGPPWAWPNLTSAEAECLDTALDEFVGTYNRVHAHTIADVIPPCWRHHPSLAQELPVQFWAWWNAHLDQGSTILTALEYYNRHLPSFHQRLTATLLGKGAVNCRKGNHSNSSDPALIDAINPNTDRIVEGNGRSETTRRALGEMNFGAS